MGLRRVLCGSGSERVSDTFASFISRLHCRVDLDSCQGKVPYAQRFSWKCLSKGGSRRLQCLSEGTTTVPSRIRIGFRFQLPIPAIGFRPFLSTALRGGVLKRSDLSRETPSLDPSYLDRLGPARRYRPRRSKPPFPARL